MNLKHDWNVIEGLLEAYRWDNSETSIIFKKMLKFGDLWGEFPYLGIWGPKTQKLT